MEFFWQQHHYFKVENSMKIIHTSDWHLGHSFYGYERSEEHLCFLKQLCDIVRNEAPDALIISGDVYDSVAPTIAAQKLYNRMILELRATAPAMKIIITAGNHDSSSRLELNGELWSAFDVKIVGNIERNENTANYEKHIISVENSEKKTVGYIVAVPYVYHANYPAIESETESRMHYFHRQLLAHVQERNSNNLPVIMTGHLAVCGANIRGHESKCTHLVYENIEELGEGYDYLALGHIHHPQAVNGSDRARYSGSPIPLNFDENYPHSVSIVEIEQHDTLPTVREATIEPLVPIYTIQHDKEGIDTILEEIDTLPKRKSYVRVRLKVKDVIPMRERAMIEEKFSGLEAILCEIQPVRETVSTSEQSTFAPEEIRQLSPLDIAMDYYRRQFGKDMSKELQQMLLESIEAVNNVDKED